ncbi:MAG: hypothetical protein P0Y62_18545 [Candidatus Chryseobacterium colombiense]|nr:hypothetical protein [Chryseobacterium sp.]WEK69795.1 MAG: hypothetical protein P0Y62_18545 [Chryseobacterium sp.]
MKIVNKLVFLFTIINSLAFAQNKKIQGNEYEMTGKIINNVSLPPGCGYIAFGIIIEFEIIDTNFKNYTNNQIPIIITCPETYGKDFLKKNKTYKLIFSDKQQNDFGWTISNLGILEKYALKKQFWLITIKST